MLHTDLDVIVDSDLSEEGALAQNPDMLCPDEIIQKLKVVPVTYYSFDNKLHQGQIVIHEDLVEDILGAFELMLQEHFPVQSVIPVSDPKFYWRDATTMAVNNTSGFNYRFIMHRTTFSNHAHGRAVDINPATNPCMRGDDASPAGSIYDPDAPGTITADGSLVEYFVSRGWVWGAADPDDPEIVDYQHFQKS